MPQILTSWKRKTGPGKEDVKGINVTKTGVEFWFETPDTVASRVSLHRNYSPMFALIAYNRSSCICSPSS